MKNRLKILLYIFAFCFFTFAFVLPEIIMGTPASPAVGNWYQQFLPSLPNLQVSDMYFQDSLTGYIVTGNGSPNDSSGFILKTTNGGDNWILKFAEFRDFSRVKFINANTGFVSGGYFNGARIYKTTNAGENWSPIGIPGGGQIYFDDMSVLNEDTIWVVASNSLVGGVFLTINGGVNWTSQINLGSLNPEKIYMYNFRIGYISKNLGSSGYVRKTTDGGASWSLIINNDYYADIYFADSLLGWKCSVFGMKKTTNGGLNWITQTLPYGGIISSTGIQSFSNINKDTILGVGGYVVYPNNQIRGMLYRTTNGGDNWLFQIPDTSIHIGGYSFMQFTDKLHGWAYNIATGIHTRLGGDTNFTVGVKYISSTLPDKFALYQNFPNPFNPVTNIKYQITKNSSSVRLVVFDVTGRELITLVNQKQGIGTYLVDFDANNYSSGIYFYSLIIDGKTFSTKKMILIK